jgi:hypothetical protein
LTQSLKTHHHQGGHTPQHSGTQQKHDIHLASPIKSMGGAYFSGRKNGEESEDGAVKMP